MVVVLDELPEGIVLTVLIIDLFHQLGIARTQIKDLIFCIIQVLVGFLYDSGDDCLVSSTHFSKEVGSVMTTDHEVLEDVVDQSHLFVDPAMD